MIIETYNVSGYGSLRPYLACTKAHLILVQGFHLLGEKALEASQAARMLGRKVVQSEATPEKRGVLLEGSWCLPDPGSGYPSFPNVCPKFASPVLLLPGSGFLAAPPFVAVSAYLISVVGMVQENADILQAIGEAASFFIGGDFNAGLEEVAETGFAEKMCSDFLGASDGFGSCKGPTKFSNIDYFCCESNLARGVVSTATAMDMDPHPHRPVRMEVSTRDADYSYCVFEAMPAIPRERIFGPPPQPPEWGGLLAAVAAF